MGLREFPRGACGDAAILLGAYLIDQGYPGFDYMLGERGYAADGTWTTHAWLERDQVIVDITGDQFSDQDEGVFVGRGSAWHDTFSREKQNAGDFRVYDKNTVASLEPYYEVLRKNLCAY
ncbi:MAG: hypothetical protein AB7V45_09725 [Candidatus Krumholzibacteriia bacterium]